MPRLVVFSGAGLSAESGIPTFRATDGTWENHKILEVCYFPTWKRNFEKVHSFYNDRREKLGTVSPNSAHAIIADWQKRYETVLLTQNIDDLLERAGCQHVVHLHGFLTEMECTACGHIWDIGATRFDAGTTSCPVCPSKKGVKPHVVFFSEAAPKYEVMHKVFASLKHDDILVVVGTSGNVISVDNFITSNPVFSILNNLDTSDMIDESLYNKLLYMPATQGLIEVDAIIKERFGF